MNELAGFLPFLLIAVVFWFLIVRPQRRRQQALAETQSAAGPGTEVMLGSGLYGTVVSVADDTLQLEIAPGTRVKVARQAVARIVDEHGADQAQRSDQQPLERGDENPGGDSHQ